MTSKSSGQLLLPFSSTEEAMNALESAHGDLIERARQEAVNLCKQHGFVHSRMVRNRMNELGLLSHKRGEFWLGSVFRSPMFKWNGTYFTYSDESRNVHERTIKVWVLTQK